MTDTFDMTKSRKPDNVNHPSHYTQGRVECIDAIESAVTGLVGMEAVLTGNVIKYMWRWKHKNGNEDLCKARYYISRLIMMQRGNNDDDIGSGGTTD